MSQACSDINVVRQQLVSVGESRGCTLMVRGPRHGSLSGVLYGCARLPIHTSGGSTDGNQPLLLLSSLSHAFLQLHALLPLTGPCFQMLRPSCAPSSGVPWSCPFGRCTLLSKNHTGFHKPNQLFAVGVCGLSVSPTSVIVCGGAGRMCESRVGPISFGWSQRDDGRTIGKLMKNTIGRSGILGLCILGARTVGGSFLLSCATVHTGVLEWHPPLKGREVEHSSVSPALVWGPLRASCKCWCQQAMP